MTAIFKNARVRGENVHPEDYHTQTKKRGEADYVMSRSDLVEFHHNPRRWRKGFDDETTDAMEWGTLVDCLTLTPAQFTDRYAIAPQVYPCEPTKKDPRTTKPWNRNADYCKEWEESQAGKAVIKFELYQRAVTAKDVLLDSSDVWPVFADAARSVHVTADYHDAETGLIIPVKILIDCVPDAGNDHGRTIADLKTCESGDPHAWQNAVFHKNYHVQAALYLDVYVAATGEDRVDFTHVWQESYAPYECGGAVVSSEFMELGRLKYRQALAKYADCLKGGQWPGYDPGPRVLPNGFRLTEPKQWMLEAA